MATFTKRIGLNSDMLRDQYVSQRTPNWIADYNASSFSVQTEEELFPDEWYGGIYNGSFRFQGVTIPPGSVINSAKITFTDSFSGGGSQTINEKIIGVDVDDMATQVISPVDDARTRTHTTAVVDWDLTFTMSVGTDRDTSDISSIIQEIIDRPGWADGNDIGIYVYDDGTTLGVSYGFENSDNSYADAPILTIEYTPPTSPSASPSLSPSSTPSSSVSRSPSASQSPSASPSLSPSISSSLSPSLVDKFFGLRVAKEGKNVLTAQNPFDFIFNSDYGTLKYYSKQTAQITINGSTGDFAGTATINHNLGYYPFVEVYVNVYIGSSDGTYEYCPFTGAGASVAYSANFRITTTGIVLYGEFTGVSSSVWVFDFIVFIYKNNLQLS